MDACANSRPGWGKEPVVDIENRGKRQAALEKAEDQSVKTGRTMKQIAERARCRMGIESQRKKSEREIDI